MTKNYTSSDKLLYLKKEAILCDGKIKYIPVGKIQLTVEESSLSEVEKEFLSSIIKKDLVEDKAKKELGEFAEVTTREQQYKGNRVYKSQQKEVEPLKLIPEKEEKKFLAEIAEMEKKEIGDASI